MIFHIIKYLIARFFSLFYPYKKKNIWLISERHNDARDNGFHFYKYMATNHPEIECYYAIDTDCSDYEKIKNIGKSVAFGSWKHYILYFKSYVLLSTHIYGYAPDYRVFKKLDGLFDRRPKIRVFLQHGVIMNFHPQDMCEKNNISLYVVSAMREMSFLMQANHYPKSNMCLSGLARYDNLIPFETKKQILVMPTWRGELSHLSEQDFLESKYYQNYMSLMNNETLLNFLSNSGFKLVFYPHYEMQRFISLFHLDNSNVIIANHEDWDVQGLLKESALLITDYSSIHFDFAYMKKPIAYFHFDVDDFYEKHYTKGYFDFQKDGFGPVYRNIEEIVKFIVSNILDQGAKMSQDNKLRVDNFFAFRDKKNCERIFEAIMQKK